MLPIAAHHSLQLYASGALSVLALGAVAAISYGAIAILVRRRGSTAATIAVLVGGSGAFCGAIVNVFVGFNLAAAASAQLNHGVAAQFLIANLAIPYQARRSRTSMPSAEILAPIIVGDHAVAQPGACHVRLAVLFAVGFELAGHRPGRSHRQSPSPDGALRTHDGSLRSMDLAIRTPVILPEAST